MLHAWKKVKGPNLHQPPPQWLVEPQWFFSLFALLWVGICGLLSLFSGWSGLASHFRAEQPVLGERFRFVSGSMGSRFFPVHYGNCLFITVNDSGFRLSIFFPFRFLTPPLFIPWEAVDSIEPKRFLFFLRYSVIRLRDQWPAISVRGGAGQRIADVYGSRAHSTEHQLAY
ncbi:MAG: hypothetical protein JWM63_1090 [Gammaproteobacteria bacterium]|nr:hypothetical protein [Gammaproteobacteria bacterium]